MPLHIATPLVESLPIGLAAGRTILLKLESLQPSGSFKTRGMGATCEAHAQRGATRFVSSSGGNAGLAVAYAARKLGLPAVVVVPTSTTERAKTLIARENADVIVHGDSWQEAHAYAVSLLGPLDALIHPFDEPTTWAGHATMIDEIARQTAKPDAVVLSVGGGGLFSGVVEGLRRQGWEDVPVIAVETEGAASLHRSVEAGERVTLEAITSLATTLGAKQVCARAFELARSHPTTTVVVSDRSAVDACVRFLDDHRIVVEPACGAALALAYERHAALADFERVLVIVCGGATATVAQLQAWARDA